MNMGQRFLQLNHTFTANDDGSLTLHVAQMPPQPNIFQPGPAFVYVTINGIPSTGHYVIVGSGAIEKQPVGPVSVLPATKRSDAASGSADGSQTSTDSSGHSDDDDSSLSTGAIIGIAVGGLVVLGLLGALIGVCIARNRRKNNRQPTDTSFMMNSNANPTMAAVGAGAGGYGLGAGAAAGQRGSESSAFVPLRQDYANHDSWASSSTASLHGPYRDQAVPQPHAPFQGQEYAESRNSGNGMSMDYDPYAADSRLTTMTPGGHRY